MSEREEALELLETYLDDVRQYLPEDIANDVVEELRTHIIDKSTEMGGLTVRNVYKVIRQLGEPRELASRYAIDTSKKQISFELGISTDLYPYFVKIIFWLTIFMVIGYTARIFSYVTATEAIEISKIILTFVEMIIGISVTILMLYLVMSFLSSNPDLRKMFLDFVKEIFGPEKKKKEKKIKEKPAEYVPEKAAKPDYKERVKLFKERRILPHTPPILSLIGGILAIIIAYIVIVYSTRFLFSWLMELFNYSLGIYFILIGIIELGNYIYVSYTEKRSYLVNVLKTLISFIFIPWLMLANIYTEQIQIPFIDLTREYIDMHELISSIKLIYLPSEYIMLAKLLTILFVSIIIVNGIITWIKYVKTSPRRRALEILESQK